MKQKLNKTKVIPEEYRIPDNIIPLKRYSPELERGLTQEQVQERISQGEVNHAVESASKSQKEIIYSNIFTYFNLVFFVIAILLIVVGSFRDLTFLPVIIANTLIGIIQEMRSKKVLDNLSILNAPKSTVVRDGEKKVIQAEELVLDDIVIFTAGNQIPADAVVEDGEILVNESLITGESDQISKKKGDSLMSGSFVVSGECRARVEKVGADSYVSKLTLEAKAMNDEEVSEMIRSLDRLVKIVGFVIIPIGIILFSQQYFINNSSLKSSVTATVAAIIGMIPEGLYLLTSAALVVSVMRLAMQKVLVHNMKCIETLARVDVLCVDKTGTITDNTMSVKKMLPLRKISDMVQTAPGAVAGSDAGVASDGAQLEAAEKEVEAFALEAAFSVEEAAEMELAVGDFAAAMATDNITMKAIKDYFRKRSGKRPEKVYSFSSATKYSGAVFEDANYVLGAPEFILQENYDQYAAQIECWSRQGYRVLVFAKYQGILNGEKLTQPADPMGMILLANPIRENAPETFRYFARQGVKIKVISGDNAVTVSEVAKEAGISDADSYVDATTLTDDEQLKAAAEKYTVFGRVTPTQKRQLVSAMKKAGHTVAMTGDGVNDVLALKDADCSIAMASGSDAAAQVAQIVLLESDFGRMPSVVAEGRRVVNNIERTASLFLVKNIFSLCLSILTILLMVNYPLEPSQISLISMFTIGIPAFVMSQEQNTDRIQGHFLSNVLFKALPGGLTDFIVISSLYLFCMEFNVSEGDVSTASTIILAIVGLMILYQIASPMTKIHWILWFGMAGGLIYCMTFVSKVFAITGISKKTIMLLVIFAIITEPVFRYLSIGIRKLSEMYMQRRQRQRHTS
ncbi:MAG: cation-translocating P-type ATPase [Lachnospiraceae bacterium]|nr:cation-translocating P-type ATPase [Lachnospiraceae bacterium]